MKKSVLKLLTLSLFFTLAFAFQSFAQGFEGIASALRSGNAVALAGTFQTNVEITIRDAGNSYSKSQAEMVLKNFFASNQPKGFALAHEGTSPEGSKYFIGNLSTTGGNYRTYVYAKLANGVLSVQEIRFEAQ